MSNPPLVPPIKCQGIKTKLVTEIRRVAGDIDDARWVEPFCGSSVVALNLQPARALLADTNVHIIKLYQDIQNCTLTASIAREFLTDEGEALRRKGEEYFYEVRARFNECPSSLDFLFLNRSCFNGVMRFNRRGKFNVPFCRKPDRFSQAYVTKITNQIRAIASVIAVSDWEFSASDFRTTLGRVNAGDVVYCDPPYSGRHVDYFNSWSDDDEQGLAALLSDIPARFILSTWHSNEFRTNSLIAKNWSANGFHIFTREHFYHVGSREDLRHPIIEALITNFPIRNVTVTQPVLQHNLFVEQPRARYA